MLDNVFDKVTIFHFQVNNKLRLSTPSFACTSVQIT